MSKTSPPSFYNNFILNNQSSSLNDNNLYSYHNNNKYTIADLDKAPDIQTDSVNVLKDKYTLMKNDYDKLKLSQEYNKQFLLSAVENEKNKQIKINKQLFNLSLNEIINNLSVTLINIINDLSILFSHENTNNNKVPSEMARTSFVQAFLYIFTKDDNLLYVGILFIILSFSLWIINISS